MTRIRGDRWLDLDFFSFSSQKRVIRLTVNLFQEREARERLEREVMQQRELLSELAREVVRLQIFCSGPDKQQHPDGDTDSQLSSQLELTKIV